MKTTIKPSLLILFSLLLSLVNMFLPATKIQYQVSVNASQSTTTSPAIINKEGYESAVSGDKYGQGAISCLNPRLASLPSTGFVILLFAWRYIAFGLICVPFFLASDYAVSRKIPLREFFAWATGIGGMLIIIPLIIQVVHPEPVQPLCDFNDLYRIVSFMPNWLFIPLSVVAILLGYFGTRRNRKNEKAVVTRP